MAASNEKKVDVYKKSGQHVVAGCLARMTAAILMCPFDTIKTRIQFQGNLGNVKRYQGFLDAARRIYTEEGLLSFGRGLPARLIYAAPAAGVSFFFYELVTSNIRAYIRGDLLAANWWAATVFPLAGISIARLLGSTLRTPFDVVKQRMQIQGSLSKQTYKNTWQAAYGIATTEGVRGMFKGAHIAFLRDAPGAIIYFFIYEVMKDVQRAALGKKSNSELGVVNHLLGGATASFAATTVTIPIDVIKTRLQTQAGVSASDRRYNGIFDAARKIVAEEGYRGLKRGLGPRLLYLCPSGAITWASYEQFKLILAKVWPVDGPTPSS